MPQSRLCVRRDATLRFSGFLASASRALPANRPRVGSFSSMTAPIGCAPCQLVGEQVMPVLLAAGDGDLFAPCQFWGDELVEGF
jgi:hypothetical protein